MVRADTANTCTASKCSAPSAPTGQVERHPAFGRGAVRAARITKVLQDPSWNWGGLVTFFVSIAALGISVLYALHWTGVAAKASNSLNLIVGLLVPGVLTGLKLLIQVSTVSCMTAFASLSER